MASSRRAHHKSRGGCTTCKAKKVKCDEAQPCSYCAKRELPCSLAPSAAPGTEMEMRMPDVDLVARPYEPPTFTLTDLGLYRHFIKFTTIAHADNDATLAVWREVIADLATQYPYLMHEILALAALHLRSAAPEQAGSLDRAAAEHQAKAISSFREALLAMSAETAVPLFACSCIFVPYHLVAAKDASSLLFNEETGSVAEWIVLIQGCAAITTEYNDIILRSSILPLLGDLSSPKVEEFSSGLTDARLVDLNSRLPVAPEDREVYEHVMEKLRLCFYLSDQANTLLDLKNAAFRFPIFISQHFRAGLAARHPAALIIMAWWCLLLHRVEDRWWLKGRIGPLLRKIEELVPPEHRHLMAWVMALAGGL
ncbi:hypothetical protein GGR54DRAFT_611551 [Hypoxylon sp. NC1633]|nr:hypothetical protein GGR54DRAFT_611551 [Hypoxylon sp. NC1633]